MSRKKTIDLGSKTLFFVVFTVLLAMGVYLYFVTFVASDFRFPRTKAEANYMYNEYFALGQLNGANCSATNDIRYGANWYWMHSHFLHAVVYMLFPLLFLVTLATDSASGASLSAICILTTSLGVIALSITGYAFIVAECGNPEVTSVVGDRFCGPRCLYNIHDITNTTFSDSDDKDHSSFVLFQVFVPILWGFSLLFGLSSLFLFRSVYKNKEDAEEELGAAERKREKREDRQRLTDRLRRPWRRKGGEDSLLDESSSLRTTPVGSFADFVINSRGLNKED